MLDVELSGPPSCYEVEYQSLLTLDALIFIVELVRHFDSNVEQVGLVILRFVRGSVTFLSLNNF